MVGSVTGLKSTTLTALLVALLAGATGLSACGGAGQLDTGEPPLPVFTAPPDDPTSTPAAVSTDTKASVTYVPGTGSSSTSAASKYPPIPTSALPVLNGFSYLDVEQRDPITLPKVSEQPKIHGVALVAVAKGNSPNAMPTASLELVRMDPSRAGDPALNGLASRMATALVHGRATTSKTVAGVRLLMADDPEGIGVNAGVFRNHADVVLVFSPDKTTIRKIVAAYLAAA